MRMDKERTILEKSRSILENVTPLRADCGQYCAKACCQGDADDNGMWLFPGEREWMNTAGARFVPGSGVMTGETLYVCDGRCDRRTRPLACRLFPLAFRLEQDLPTVEPDIRAWPICPLMQSGLQGMSPDFVQAVQQVYTLLWQDDAQQAFLRKLDQSLNEYRALRL